MARRLLLVGAGPAHLEVLRRLALAARAGGGRPPVDLQVVSTHPAQPYSGMVPGYVAGTRALSELVFDLPALAAAAGGRFTEGRAVRIDRDARVVELAEGGTVGWDLVSFAIGSGARGGGRPEVRAHAAPLKPIPASLALRARLEALAGAGGAPAAVVVVGGGAAGFELACAAAHALAARDRAREVTLLEGGPRLLGAGYADRAVRLAARALARRGIALRTGVRAEGLEAGGVLAGGERLRADLVVWATGAEAPALFRDSGLPTDAEGFLLVDSGLRSPADPRVFAAGDCATLSAHPGTPKAGVFSVRQGPILYAALGAALAGSTPPTYVPQRRFLTILDAGDGRALLHRPPFVSLSGWAWRLKRAIDQAYVRRYRTLTAA